MYPEILGNFAFFWSPRGGLCQFLPTSVPCVSGRMTGGRVGRACRVVSWRTSWKSVSRNGTKPWRCQRLDMLYICKHIMYMIIYNIINIYTHNIHVCDIHIIHTYIVSHHMNLFFMHGLYKKKHCTVRVPRLPQVTSASCVPFLWGHFRSGLPLHGAWSEEHQGAGPDVSEVSWPVSVGGRVMCDW